MRFILVGFVPDKGYAVKDLEDGVIEYFSLDKVIEMSEVVEIMGVSDGKVDLDWFRSYFARAVLTLGNEKAREELCFTLNSDNKLVPFFKHNVKPNVDFLEMAESDCIIFWFELWGYFTDKFNADAGIKFRGRSRPFLYDDYNIRRFGHFPFSLINVINIQNVLADGATVKFLDRLKYRVAVIEDLKMKNCTYIIKSPLVIFLINKPKETKLVISNLSSICSVYICNSFDLDDVELSSMNSYPKVFIEDCVDMDKVDGLFYRYSNELRDALHIRIFEFNRSMIQVG